MDDYIYGKSTVCVNFSAKMSLWSYIFSTCILLILIKRRLHAHFEIWKTTVFERFQRRQCLKDFKDDSIWKISKTTVFERFQRRQYLKDFKDNSVWKISKTTVFEKFQRRQYLKDFKDDSIWKISKTTVFDLMREIWRIKTKNLINLFLSRLSKIYFNQLEW